MLNSRGYVGVSGDIRGYRKSGATARAAAREGRGRCRGSSGLAQLYRSRRASLPGEPAPAVELDRRAHAEEVQDRRHHVAHVGLARLELDVGEEDALDEGRVDRAVVAAPDAGVGLDDR